MKKNMMRIGLLLTAALMLFLASATPAKLLADTTPRPWNPTAAYTVADTTPRPWNPTIVYTVADTTPRPWNPTIAPQTEI